MITIPQNGKAWGVLVVYLPPVAVSAQKLLTKKAVCADISLSKALKTAIFPAFNRHLWEVVEKVVSAPQNLQNPPVR